MSLFQLKFIIFGENYIWHLFLLSILILFINYSIILIPKKENGYIHKKHVGSGLVHKSEIDGVYS